MEIKKAIGGVVKISSIIAAIGGVFYFNNKKLKKANEKFEQQKNYYAVTQQWLVNKNEGKSLKTYFDTHGYKNIAIYGMGTISELLYQEIKDIDVKVSYFIDKNADEIHYGLDDIPICGLDAIEDESIDAIVVTPIYFYDEIVKDLENQGVSTEIVSLEDVVYEI